MEKNLVVIASHIKSSLQLDILKNNILYFEKPNMDIIIVYSKENTSSSFDLTGLSKNIINTIEIENNHYLDFGKWIHTLRNTEYSCYSNIVFTNDSYVLTGPIDSYLQKMYEKNYELYGFTDSTEIKYHYQSYLFYIQSSQIHKLTELFMNHVNDIHVAWDVVLYYELNLESMFSNKSCHLKIGDIEKNMRKNILFVNDSLYEELLCLGYLPIIKVKRWSTITERIRQQLPSVFHKYI